MIWVRRDTVSFSEWVLLKDWKRYSKGLGDFPQTGDVWVCRHFYAKGEFLAFTDTGPEATHMGGYKTLCNTKWVAFDFLRDKIK